MHLTDQIIQEIQDSNFSIESIKYWLDQQGLNIDAQHKAREWNLLVYGIYLNKVAAVRYLLAHRANVNAQDSLGSTPLIIALLNLEKEHMDAHMVNLVLKYKADPCIENSYGSSATSLAKSMDILYKSHFVEKINRFKLCSRIHSNNGIH